MHQDKPKHKQQQQAFRMTVGGLNDDEVYNETSNIENIGRRYRNQTAQCMTQSSTMDHISCVQQQQPSRAICQLGNKDLIIRMLAEIFQVREDSNGQARWQQVSTSLVPISLYSRTTSKWLDYLLTASSIMEANDPANAMSPDSRDFLLLLQRSHKQSNTLECNSSMMFPNNYTMSQQPQQDCIVFQVVGHDIIDAQCRKILNVKLRQPGTRLGLASNYFVYWRTQASNASGRQHNLSQQYSASSFASSATQIIMPELSTSQDAHLPNQSPETQNLSRKLTTDQLTWGLNFASVNDAKLFFDICSLNLVDLDFNSEYLRQIASNDTGEQCSRRQPQFVDPKRMLIDSNQSFFSISGENQRQSRRRGEQSLTQLRKTRINRIESREPISKQASLVSAMQTDVLNQMCPCIAHQANIASSIQVKKKRMHQTSHDSFKDTSCPIHGATYNTNKLRKRSRSTNRQTSSHTIAKERNEFKRARSFSTPASPDLRCATYKRRHRLNTNTTDDERQMCPFNSESIARTGKFDASESLGRPQKPMRGLLRSSCIAKDSSNASTQQLEQHQHQVDSMILSNRSISKDGRSNQEFDRFPTDHGTKRDNRLQDFTSQLRQHRPCSYSSQVNNSSAVSQSRTRYEGDQPSIVRESKYSNNNTVQRRSQTSTFDTLARRDARSARERYANSRNMKEFLSLDAGGFQSIPLQHLRASQLQTLEQHLSDNQQSSQSTKSNKAITTRHAQRHSTSGIINSNLISQKVCPISDNKDFTTIDRYPMKQKEPLKSNSKNIEEEKSIHHNVSPLGNRISKPTSEEIISEQTEPKSLSPSTVVTQQEKTDLQQTQDQKHQANKIHLKNYTTKHDIEKSDHQIRAVSLGPCIGLDSKSLNFSKDRCRSARSDAGRRRSLERSTCIDLDNSSFVKPLNTISKHPDPNLKLQSIANVPSKSTIPTEPVESQKLHDPVANEIQTEKIKVVEPNASSTMTQTDCIQSSTLVDRQRKRRKLPNENNNYNSEMSRGDVPCNTNDQRIHHVHQFFEMSNDGSDHIASFNLDPTINPRQICYKRDNTRHKQDCASRGLTMASMSDNHPTETRVLSNLHNQHEWIPNVTPKANALSTKRKSNMNSYAVPLCANVKRIPYKRQHALQTSAIDRQCHSCPSSLRRGQHLQSHRKVDRLNCYREVNMGSDDYGDPNLRNICSCYRVLHCPCSHQSTLQAEQRCVGHRLAPPFGLHCECHVDTSSHYGHHRRLVDDGHQTKSECLDCGLIYDSTLIHDDEYNNLRASKPLSVSTCLNLNNLQCNITPSQCEHQFILNETGLERSNADHQMQKENHPTFRPQSSQSSRSQMYYGLNESDLEDKGSNLTCRDLTKSNSVGYQNMSRSQSAHFQRTIVKPVSGYDQTLARASLKSRQRSRSQPPARQIDADNAYYLSKSIENVEKLIKEVQNELNSLKARPMGSAMIDLKSSGDERQNLEMSQEEGKVNREKNTELTNQTIKEQMLEPSACTSATKRAGQFKCVGAIRKAGFLSVKKWILKRNQSIELARKQGWKKYWVCLRGTALLFHSIIDQNHFSECDNNSIICLRSWIQNNCSSQSNILDESCRLESTLNADNKRDVDQPLSSFINCYIEKEPKHLILIDGSIAQPIPEHPRRDFVFCLSTTFGDAYLFQASCQLESDNWISAIHNACAASIARDLSRDDAIKSFDSKIRHLEVEADKKLFLRQRLESRLTSMSSMLSGKELMTSATEERTQKLTTMRSLLYQLAQQLMALDLFLEQLHCEVYQFRCYLTSCGLQGQFYKPTDWSRQEQESANVIISKNIDLPHPKSLLMHVSKSTKLMLIKMGVFTVSSFHAYIHARQDNSKSLLNKIDQAAQSSCPSSPKIELRLRSQSINDSLLSKQESNKLEKFTEELLDLADVKTVAVRIEKTLIARLRNRAKSNMMNNVCNSQKMTVDEHLGEIEDDTSDDRYSVQVQGDNTVILVVKVNSNSNSFNILSLVLKIIDSNLDELEFLNYYLRLVLNSNVNLNGTDVEGTTKHRVIRRKDILRDWGDYDFVELKEKIIYRLELIRCRSEEMVSIQSRGATITSLPFGIAIEGQLHNSQHENILNVYCSYIEWGSVADKAGLQEEDEFLMIGGCPVAELDLMFVECLVQDSSRLRIVVRSSRDDAPLKTTRLDRDIWQSSGSDDEKYHDKTDNSQFRTIPRDTDGGNSILTSQQHGGTTVNTNLHYSKVMHQTVPLTTSQIMSDEYLTSLVCPPPPARSNAFLRTDSNLLRQKSDLGMRDSHQESLNNQYEDNKIIKSKSQHMLDSSPLNCDEDIHSEADAICTPTVDGTSLARQLLQKTERLSRLLIGTDDTTDLIDCDRIINVGTEATQVSKLDNVSEHSGEMSSGIDNLEKLQKSLLELVETEYAYLKHLETINEHYMLPLQEAGFLNIADLKSFNKIVQYILDFQHAFFNQLTSSIFSKLTHIDAHNIDEYEIFNKVVQEIDSSKSVDTFSLIIASISQLFSSDSEKFRIYAAYCVAYSKLQKILHPTSSLSNSTNNLSCNNSSLIVSIPSALNTFSTSMNTNMASPSSLQRLNSKFIGFARLSNNTTDYETGDQNNQLRRLTDFLVNLDSSSSSISFSLTKSSKSCDHQSISKSSLNQLTRTSGGNSSSSSSIANQRNNVHQQNFESYLIKPVQRIVKYPMLLSSIASAASQTISKAQIHQELQVAIKQMEKVVNQVNDTQRIQDEYGLVFESIESQFYTQYQQNDLARSSITSLFGPHQPPIILSIDQLLYFNQVNWLNVDEFAPKGSKRTSNLSSILFVFKSCVIFICSEKVQKFASKRKLINQECSASNQQITNNFTSRVFPWSSSIIHGSQISVHHSNEQFNEMIRYQTLIPVSEVQVRSVPMETETLHQSKVVPGLHKHAHKTNYSWELFQCSSSNSNSGLLAKSTISAKKQNFASSGNNKTDGRIYLLSSKNNEERSTFLRKIRFIIRESVRSMSLPAARSPSTSKKMSTSSAISTSSSSASSTAASTPSVMTNNVSLDRSNTTSLDKQQHEFGLEEKSEHIGISSKSDQKTAVRGN